MKTSRLHTQTAPDTYLSFMLGKELFAMEVGPVREILDPCPITRVPGGPPHMLGVINVRGLTTAVMDLRLRFGVPATGMGRDSRIIILDFVHQGERIIVGAMADSVREVLTLRPEDIAPPPSVAMDWNPSHVRGVARRGELPMILLDLPCLILDAESSLPTQIPTSKAPTS